MMPESTSAMPESTSAMNSEDGSLAISWAEGALGDTSALRVISALNYRLGFAFLIRLC